MSDDNYTPDPGNAMSEGEKRDQVTELLQQTGADQVADPALGYVPPVGGQGDQAQEQPTLKAPQQVEAQESQQQSSAADHNVPGPEHLPAEILGHAKEHQMVMQALQAEAQQIKALEQQDPGAAAAAWQSWSARRNHAMQYGQAIKQAVQQHRVTAAQGYQERLQAKVTEIIPSWKDGGVREHEKAELRQFLRGKGYSDAEIAGIRDPRAVGAVYDLWQSTKNPGSKPGAKRLRAGQKRTLDTLVKRAIKKATGPGAETHNPARAVSELLASL